MTVFAEAMRRAAAVRPVTHDRTYRAEYAAAHRRVRAERGPASALQCPCGAAAEQWAYRERSGYGEPEHYTPLCRPCHRAADA